MFVRDLAHVRALPPTTSNRREREKFDAGYIARIKRSVTGLLRSAVLGKWLSGDFVKQLSADNALADLDIAAQAPRLGGFSKS